ncbi:AI-2E family transporter [Bacillus sp. 31A1R]|uniref:AI-2E family transporter n=1 Tax=Robertmurraya mangrovi TaxID=3098077 RepID=A0ABU5J4X6_9BACI|nr:AI-2E family transporter [Bacillus sp. 31A1R]MDZ5474470.1 AI-2E family transporter [Bacillus sp. 31A1R]
MKNWLKQSYAQKIMAIGILILALYLLRHVINLILLTFIFTYLFHTIYSVLGNRTNIYPKFALLLVYGTFVSLIGFIGYKYAPIIVKQIGDIFMQISDFRLTDYEENIHPTLYEALVGLDIGHYVRELGNKVLTSIAGISSFVLQVLIALVLSFFFILDKERILLFLKKFEFSKVDFLYKYYKEFGQNFLNTFGKVVQVQIIIAAANAVLSFIGLWIIGFPQLLGLTIMIFFLGLIPVAGVIISLVPLSIIAFQIGGVVKVLHVLVMVMVVHAVENYFLNPKLYSLKMKLPIFFTFAILIISEHIMGVWGLLLGIPLFMFALDMLKVPTEGKDE